MWRKNRKDNSDRKKVVKRTDHAVGKENIITDGIPKISFGKALDKMTKK